MFQLDDATITEHRVRGRGRRVFWGILLIGGTLLTVSLLTGCARSHRHPPAEELQARIERGAEWALWKVEATDEQRTRVKGILQELTPDLVAYQRERELLVAQLATAIETGRNDPEEVARLRTAGLSLADRAIGRSIEVALRVSQVLTSEQRKELAESWKGRL